MSKVYAEAKKKKRAADAAKSIAKNKARKAAKDRQNIQEKVSTLIVSKLTLIVYTYVKRYVKFVNFINIFL
jgi:glucose uptake protein GlcU